jgi:hypothetical protein
LILRKQRWLYWYIIVIRNELFHGCKHKRYTFIFITLTDELYTDTLDIGPEFDVLDDVFLIDDEALPSFGEMLDQFVVPFRGKVISKYGMRRGRMHTGTDIKLELGDTVIAAYQGSCNPSTNLLRLWEAGCSEPFTWSGNILCSPFQYIGQGWRYH